MNKKQLGKLICELRKRNGMHQREVAEKLFVSTSAICKWENGINQPDTSTIIKLATILGVPNDALLHPEETLERLKAGEDILVPDNISEPDNITNLIPEETSFLPTESIEDTDAPPEQKTDISEPVIVPTAKHFNPVNLIGYACALVLLIMLIGCGIYLYRYFHPTFEVIDTRYTQYEPNTITYEMAILCPANVTRDALDAYTSDFFHKWNSNEFFNDADNIRLYIYSDEQEAINWGYTHETIILHKK